MAATEKKFLWDCPNCTQDSLASSLSILSTLREKIPESPSRRPLSQFSWGVKSNHVCNLRPLLWVIIHNKCLMCQWFGAQPDFLSSNPHFVSCLLGRCGTMTLAICFRIHQSVHWDKHVRVLLKLVQCPGAIQKRAVEKWSADTWMHSLEGSQLSFRKDTFLGLLQTSLYPMLCWVLWLSRYMTF